MSEMTGVTLDSAAGKTFAEGFRDITYWITTDDDNFDVAQFRNSLVPSIRDLDRRVVPVAPSDENNGPYHAFFGWRTLDDLSKRLELTIAYHQGPMRHASDEHEPYAEQLMAWLAHSFKLSEVMAHVHVRFAFQLDTRECTFPLPQSLGDAEIFGIRLRVASRPHGISTISLTKGKSKWLVEAIGSRKVVFSDFSPYEDVSALSSHLETLWVMEA